MADVILLLGKLLERGTQTNYLKKKMQFSSLGIFFFNFLIKCCAFFS